MSENLFALFRQLTPTPQLQAGEVAAVAGDWSTVAMPDGGLVQVRGVAAVGQKVFVRDGRLESEAPALPIVVIEL